MPMVLRLGHLPHDGYSLIVAVSAPVEPLSVCREVIEAGRFYLPRGDDGDRHWLAYGFPEAVSMGWKSVGCGEGRWCFGFLYVGQP